MVIPPDNRWNDSWIEELAGFDESLRLGRAPARDEPEHEQITQTQQFLRLLQSVWPRSVKRIGPYAVVRNLGQGSIGPSYLVEDPDSHEQLVLKILWPDLSANEPTRTQFVQEAQMVQGLNLAGIARLRELRDSRAVCIVVSDYCAGTSLAQWRRRHPQPIAWESAGRMLLKLTDILAGAHQQGMVHGNLKPSNLFLSHECAITLSNVHEAELTVTDFALAKAVLQTRVPAQGGLAWPAPQCLAPEQLQQRSQPTEPATDVYALGVMWYEWLTGRYPVKGTTREELVANSHAAVPPPRQYRPEIPIAVESLVLQCLERRASKRPASAVALAESLRGLLPALPSEKRTVWWKRWLGWVQAP